MSIYDDWKKFINSKEGTAFITFITTRNSYEIGQWLKKLGSAMASGKGVAGIVASTGVKLAGAGVAAWIAYQEVKRQWEETKKIWNKDDISGFEKIARIALESHPVTMTVRSIKEGWDWLTKSKREREHVNPAVPAGEKSIKSHKGKVEFKTQGDGKLVINTPIVTPEESGRQVVEHEKNKKGYREPLKTTNDKMVEYMNKMKKGGNHPTWYGKYPEYLTTNVNYGVRKEAEEFLIAIGSKVGVTLVTPQKNGQIAQAYKDAINALYVKLRGSNSGAFNYDPEDVASYIEITRSIRGLHATLVRDLKLVNNVDPYISQTPDAIMAVAGYDATGIANMKANRGIYINELNQMAAAINATMPAFPDMAIFDRTDFVAKAIIEEGKGPKSSLYMYTIDTVIGWDSANKVKSISVASNSFANRLGYLRTLIDNFNKYSNATYGGPTLVRIAGDMLKAYGQAAFRPLGLMDVNQKAEVIFDEYLLHQIQNLNTLAAVDPYSLYTTAATIYNLSFDTKVEIAGAAAYTLPVNRVYGLIDSADESAPMILNTNKSQVSGLETISLSRSIAMYKVDSLTLTYNTAAVAKLYECGSDVLTGVVTYYYTPGTQVINRYAMISRGRSVMPLEELSIWAQVDYSPCIQIFADVNNNGVFTVLLDLDTYAHITRDQFKVMNDTATLSLLKTINIQDQVNFKAVKSKSK